MSFNEDVWEMCKRIPEGSVSTYGELARALNTKAYQAVGNAMNKNPRGAWNTSGPERVPCHRVVNSDGRVGGFARGTEAKIALLEKEGVEVRNNKVDLKRYLFRF
ncbi:MGMT family protein [Candidatus Woesearchaeota archaeon]|nr:MGMT family protein [Candidatus Woesearchaeota archaeon]